jgi:O-antigen ligase
MENLSLRVYLLIFIISLIIIICPWLGGGLIEGFTYEAILILTALGIFLFVTLIIIEKKQLILEKSFLYLFLLIFIIALIISSIFSIRTYNSWSESIMWLSGIAIFFIFSQINNERIVRIICWINIIMATAVSFAGFILFMLSASETDLRLDSVLYNPNLLAGYLIGLWPIAMSIIFLEQKKIFKVILYIFNIIIGTGFILTVSYTGWVSFLPIIFLWIIYFRKKIFTKKNIVFTILACLLIFICTSGLRYFYTSSIKQGISIQKTISSSHGTSSYNQRIYFLEAGKKIFMDYPLTGIGLGNMKLGYQKIQENILETPRSLHNNYMDIAVETGILGILGWLGFIIVLCFKNIIYLKENKNYYFIGLFLGWLGMLLNGCLDFAWQIKIVVINFFIISGLLYGMCLKNKKIKNIKIFFIVFLILLSLLFLGRGVQIFFSHYYQIQGERYEGLSGYKKAITAYQTAWKYNKDPALLSKTGIAQYTKKYYADAEKTALLWIEKSSHDPSAYQLLGRVYKEQNQLVEAREQFLKAHELVPLINTEIEQDLIEIYFLLNEYDNVIQESEYFMNIYNTYNRSGYNTNLSLNLARILDYQGQAYLALNNKEKACASWQTALKERPSYGNAQQKIDGQCGP